MPTLAGEAAVKLPAGTKPDAAVRLRRKGLPQFREIGRGDLFVRVRVRCRKSSAAGERKLYERLRSPTPKSAQTKIAVGRRSP